MKVLFCPSLNLAITGVRSYIAKSIVAHSKSSWDEIESGNIKSCDSLIHLAANVSENSVSNLTNSILLDVESMQLAVELNAKYIYASTNNVLPLQVACCESTPITFNDYYSLNKCIGEKILSLSKAQHVIVRIGDVFGHDQRHGNFFKALQRSIESGEPAKLFGAGGKVRNYIYVKDLAKQLLHIAIFDSPKVVHACYAEPMSIASIIAYMQEAKHITGVEQLCDAFETNSFLDYRTMNSTKIDGFEFSFTMKSALDDFARECKNAK